jgi:hypothetical protein
MFLEQYDLFGLFSKTFRKVTGVRLFFGYLKKISTPELYYSYLSTLMFLLIKLLNDRSSHCFISNFDRC